MLAHIYKPLSTFAKALILTQDITCPSTCLTEVSQSTPAFWNLDPHLSRASWTWIWSLNVAGEPWWEGAHDRAEKFAWEQSDLREWYVWGWSRCLSNLCCWGLFAVAAVKKQCFRGCHSILRSSVLVKSVLYSWVQSIICCHLQCLKAFSLTSEFQIPTLSSISILCKRQNTRTVQDTCCWSLIMFIIVNVWQYNMTLLDMISSDQTEAAWW